MIINRIRELRQSAKLTLKQVADAVGSTTTTIQRMEKGEVDLVHPLLAPVATALGVGWLDCLGATLPVAESQLAESAAPFTPPAGHMLQSAPVRSTEALFEARDDSLSALGILPGDVVLFDLSAKAVKDLATGDIVIAQAYGPTLTSAVTVMRQFVAPALLITNRRHGPQSVIDIDASDVAVKGVARQRWGAVRPR
jgi:transcriptional regulator with XRE-family HTH domain